MHFPTWDTVAWIVALSICAALEFIGLVEPQNATLTELIKATVPLWARAVVLTWLCYHFLIQK